MRKIKLTRGKEAIVDDDDFEYLNKFKWHYQAQGGYAFRAKQHGARQMHRTIVNCPGGKFVDHINGDGLDNRKSNLRICTKAQNGMNRGRQKQNKSGFKGVVWNMRLKKWIAQIGCKGIKKTMHIGVFNSPIDAAVAYDNEAKKIHGEFAKLNFSSTK